MFLASVTQYFLFIHPKDFYPTSPIDQYSNFLGKTVQ